MIRRGTLQIVGWASIVCGPFFFLWRLTDIIDAAQQAEPNIGALMMWNHTLGGVPGLIFGVGFGAALLTLASLDRRIPAREKN